MNVPHPSAGEPSAEPEPKPRRSFWKWLAIASTAVVLVFGAFVLVQENTPHARHLRVLHRIERWAKPEVTRLDGHGEARGLCEVKCAIYTALGNSPLYYPQNAPTEKLATVADYLDRTNGADFSTYAGALHVLELLEKVSPSLQEFQWMQQLRDMQADGTIPPAPPAARSAN